MDFHCPLFLRITNDLQLLVYIVFSLYKSPINNPTAQECDASADDETNNARLKKEICPIYIMINNTPVFLCNIVIV